MLFTSNEFKKKKHLHTCIIFLVENIETNIARKYLLKIRETLLTRLRQINSPVVDFRLKKRISSKNQFFPVTIQPRNYFSLYEK